ncbi:MAG TPA: heparinase II/III family protein, partial [Opitutus sp.]|nr:heparinase II/III family protein [Opitutus sp.]
MLSRSLLNSLRCAIAGLAAVAAVHAEYRIDSKTVPTAVIQPEAAFEVHANHPRLYFRDTDLPAIRRRIRAEFREPWETMRAQIERTVLSQPAEKFAHGQYLKGWQSARSVVFVAAVTGEENYLAWSRQWMEALVAEPPGNTDDELRGRLQCLAIAYDWLYPWLNDAEKAHAQVAIVAHLEKAWRFASHHLNFVSGHSRWGNFVLAAGLLAIANERPELREKLLTVRRNWTEGYFPTQGWIASEGGYHMGWSYSSAYLTGEIHCVWSSATNDCVYFPWQAKLPLMWIYGRQGDGFYPNTGDAYTLSGDFTSLRTLLVTAAGVLKDPHARWLLPAKGDHFVEILYGDADVVARAPDEASAPLPLSRNFGPAGVVLARDRWDEASTVLQFRSVPFYSANHHHRDENSFTLHYRGPLAIDSGLYDEGGSGAQRGGYGGAHWLNYFTRTVAHNAIVVFDPTQVMTYGDTPISNDGGQPFRTEPSQLTDLLPGGAAHLDGITHYRDTPEFTVASGDATKAYDPARVRLAQRDIVYLRDSGRPHPVVVVFDRVESAKPELKKRFLLHTVNEPTVQNRLMVTENLGGRLSSLTLLPEDAKLALV